ncbi:hypothetical protein ACFQX7_29485 [Luedemannella flava]
MTDLPSFHERYEVPAGFAVTGPLFADTWMAAQLGSRISIRGGRRVIGRGRPAVLVTMGSSGTPDVLVEAIRAVAAPVRAGAEGAAEEEYNVVVLAPTGGLFAGGGAGGRAESSGSGHR